MLDGEPVRVRGLQVHGDAGRAGDRPDPAGRQPARGAGRRRAPRQRAALPGWPAPTDVVDVVLHRLADRMPTHATLHVGTTSAAVRVRPLGNDHARITLDDGSHPLPLVAGDRVVLRDPAAHEVLAGATVLDARPPPLTRRGDAVRRAAALTAAAAVPGAAVALPEWRDPAADPGGTSRAGGVRPASGPLVALLGWLDEHPLEPAPAELLARSPPPSSPRRSGPGGSCGSAA